ncbi:MAG: hypothetical protein O8C67_05805, partial [Candidatus Methanoperedens sp.]|nr:hypothetical protein [Candidatus Methanoperedens sp.]
MRTLRLCGEKSCTAKTPRAQSYFRRNLTPKDFTTTSARNIEIPFGLNDRFRMVQSSLQVWEDFFKRYYWEEILKLANEYPEKRSLGIQFPDIEKF